jgi:hypothetical protein
MTVMMTWEECAAAGMSKAEAARHRGVSTPMAVYHAKRLGLTFRNGWADCGANLRDRAPHVASGRVRSAKAKMTPSELACYDALRQGRDKLSIDDALRLIGRADLIDGKK